MDGDSEQSRAKIELLHVLCMTKVTTCRGFETVETYYQIIYRARFYLNSNCRMKVAEFCKEDENKHYKTVEESEIYDF